jgi:hypothetical protein
MPSTILPLRAIVFQFLFVVVAIVVETIALHRILRLDYKVSVQYAITVNLLSTVLGWILFFLLQPLIPEDLRPQVISFVLFDRLSLDFFQSQPIPVIAFGSLGVFIGTFLLKLQGLIGLEFLLEKSPKPELVEEKVGRLMGRKRTIGLQPNSKAYAVFVSNACSFSAILFLLFVRLFGQQL